MCYLYGFILPVQYDFTCRYVVHCNMFFFMWGHFGHCNVLFIWAYVVYYNLLFMSAYFANCNVLFIWAYVATVLCVIHVGLFYHL